MILLFLLHAVILWVLEFYPYPELFVYPYLTSSGLLPYQSIWDQHFPGLLFFPVNFFSLGFTDPVSFKSLLLLVVVSQSLLVYKISRSRLAVVVYLLWQPFFEGNQLWLDTFLGLFTLPAWLWFRSKKWWWAGLFLGMGVVFKQTLIPVVALAGWSILNQRDVRGLIKFSLAALLPSALMLVYFYRLGVGDAFWYWTVRFNLGPYAAAGRLTPTWGQAVKLALPLATIGYVFFRVKSSRMVIGWLIASIIGGLPRFGFIHLQPAVPFFALATAGLARHKKLAAGFVLLSLLWLGYFYSRQGNWLETHFFDPGVAQLAAAISSRTRPGEEIFLLGVQPHLYALTRTLPTGRTFVFQFPWFLQVRGREILAALTANPPRVVVYDSASRIDGQNLSDYADYLVEYVARRYQPVDRVGSAIVYEYRD